MVPPADGGNSMTRMIAIALTATAVALTSNAAFAANKKLNASREQVEAACDANGGFAWGTGASGGRYGCMTDNAWVECDEEGSCEGGKARTVIRTMPLAPSSGLIAR
jgi:hypothetical protein